MSGEVIYVLKRMAKIRTAFVDVQTGCQGLNDTGPELCIDGLVCRERIEDPDER